jgi:hypothetical protein
MAIVVLPDPPLGFKTTIRCMVITSGRTGRFMSEGASVRSGAWCCKRLHAHLLRWAVRRNTPVRARAF